MNPTLYKLIKIVFMTAFGGFFGAVLGGLLAMNSVSQAQCASMFARDSSAFFAALFGIEAAMSGIRGKEDLRNQLCFWLRFDIGYNSFVSQGLKVKPAHALSWAAWYAFASGTMYKVDETIRSLNAQDAFYTDSRAMLSKLGLEEYEKNFKKAHLTDYTLPLLTDSDLKEVDIPSGARLLILDHIKRYHKMVNRK